ncbi:DUF2533 family protein [Aeribacillus pallidus]|jgi:predicted transcriptional regulator|uniref:DUF2533 family protein n=1 Tax=Aeribacillus TaxID=1055323 RepID=UPI001023CCCC|nr:DUF2533 family protein [Aeribacillus pallidus]MDR9793574.1 DUF2533 family protein [Aeribacillus pallidus]RZI50618.1 DUF2533 family protein [Aeribacillus pallidus]
MAEVHKEITKHSNRQHEIVKKFLHLEEKREQAIDEAVKLCEKGLHFSVQTINEITKEMNELARATGIVPQRKYVTEEMVKEYVSRKQS